MMQTPVKYMISILLLISLTLQASYAQELVLTGQVSSSSKQVINAPQSSRWQIQIQWMEDEGKIVQKGESVVVFDGASEQARLTLEQENLDRLTLELAQLNIQQSQYVMDAEGRYIVAKMRVEKAKIEASVADEQVAALEKGQYELALQRAMLEQVKADEAQQRARQERKAEVTKKELNILKVKEEIAYLNTVLANLNVLADITGPVNYATHPWYGTKLSAGMNVRASWKVLDVQSTSNFQIETWIHEIDAVNLSQGMPLSIILDAYPEQRYAGVLTKLSKQSESKSMWSKSAYFPAIVQFAEPPNLALLPGMSVRLLVDGSSVGQLAKPSAEPSVAQSEHHVTVSQTSQGLNRAKNQVISAPAELVSLQEISLTPPNIRRMWEYKIEYIARENSLVEKGDTIIKFDGQKLRTDMLSRNSELDAATKEAEQKKLQNEARYEELVLDLAEAKKNQNIAQRKVEITDVSRSDIERRKQQSELKITTELNAQATQRLEQHAVAMKINEQVQAAKISKAQSRVDELTQSIERLSVTAPAAGMVVLVSNDDEKPAVGDTVYMGRRLISLPALDKLSVKVEFDESYTPNVNVGDPVQVMLDAFPEKPFTGRITELGKSYRSKSRNNLKRVFDAWVTLDALDLTIMRPGMKARVDLLEGES